MYKWRSSLRKKKKTKRENGGKQSKGKSNSYLKNLIYHTKGHINARIRMHIFHSLNCEKKKREKIFIEKAQGQKKTTENSLLLSTNDSLV